jgi:hypothetical protein
MVKGRLMEHGLYSSKRYKKNKINQAPRQEIAK